MDADRIDPTRDRVWAVEVEVNYTAYVVATSAAEAERIGREAADDFDPVYRAHELTEQLEPQSGASALVPYGPSRWEDRELTVNEAVELIAEHKPVYDTETILMPFVDSPPPIHPRRPEDDEAAGRSER